VFIQAISTSDPTTMRFEPGRRVAGSESLRFASPEEARLRSPLAARLLDVPGIEAVELGPEHVSVTRGSGANQARELSWTQIKPMVLAAIMDHFMAGLPAVHDEPGQTPQEEAEDSDIVRRLKTLLTEKIRPRIVEDGGDVAFDSYDESAGLAVIALSSAGLRTPAFGTQIKIENTIKHHLPEVRRVAFSNMRAEAPQHENDEERPGLATQEGLTIRRLLEERINPAIAAHGGRIELIDLQGDKAFIRMDGGCQGCGMADVTLKQGVEVEIRDAVPAISHVFDVTDHANGLNPYYEPR
jgi:Fe-S cluster biogenesis protein NfuA